MWFGKEIKTATLTRKHTKQNSKILLNANAAIHFQNHPRD